MQQQARLLRKILVGTAAVCAALALSACATWRDNVQSQLGDAKKVIDTAKSAGAERYAPETIKSADKYVAQAQQLITLGKFQDASRSVQQALADGQLAKVQAESGGRNAEIQGLREEIASLMK
jgi:hypothetical protein